MKKINVLMLSVFTVAVIAVNFSIISENSTYTTNFNLNSLQNAFAGTIEEVTVTCSSGDEGQCFSEIPGQLVMCGEITAFTVECSYTGSQNDSCERYDPCA